MDFYSRRAPALLYLRKYNCSTITNYITTYISLMFQSWLLHLRSSTNDFQVMIFTLENQEETWNSGLIPAITYCTWPTLGYFKTVTPGVIRSLPTWSDMIAGEFEHETHTRLCHLPPVPKWVIWEWGAIYNRYYSRILVCLLLSELQCANPPKHTPTHGGFNHTRGLCGPPVACLYGRGFYCC